MSADAGPSPAVVRAVLIMLSAALALAAARLFRGPDLPDRVVSLDLIATIAIGFIAAHAIATGKAVLLSPAVALSLLAFLGTVAFAGYISRGGGS